MKTISHQQNEKTPGIGNARNVSALRHLLRTSFADQMASLLRGHKPEKIAEVLNGEDVERIGKILAHMNNEKRMKVINALDNETYNEYVAYVEMMTGEKPGKR